MVQKNLPSKVLPQEFLIFNFEIILGADKTATVLDYILDFQNQLFWLEL